MARFEERLKDDPDIEQWSSYVGQGAIRFYLPLDQQLENAFFGQFVIRPNRSRRATASFRNFSNSATSNS